MMNSQNCRPESNFTGLRAALGFTIITEKEIVLMVIIMTTVLYNKQQVDRAHVSMKSSGKSQTCKFSLITIRGMMTLI